MKKLAILIILFSSLGTLFAQNLQFTAPDPQPDIIEMYGGDSSSGDIDGDGDLDLIVTGLTPGRTTVLYTNDGSGNFTEVMGTSLPNASVSRVFLRDLDGDSDLDLFFSGNGGLIQEFTRIYINDGSGVFTEKMNPSLPQFADWGVDFADVDGDDDLDMVIAVQDKDDVFTADVYLNDGAALFTPLGLTSIAPVYLGAVEFLDVESDGDEDVLISGELENGLPSVILYLNDGSGNYTEDASTNFAQVGASDIDAADVDNDGDMDFLMSGTDAANEVYTKMYINDGSGQFTDLSTSTIQNTFGGTNAFADFDNDGDLDILTVGSQDGGLPNIFNIVYENKGNNVFVDSDTLGGEYIAMVEVADFNGDDLADIIIQGFVARTTVYWNSTTVTSINDVPEFTQNSIFPNPTTGMLTIELDGELTAFNFQVYAMNGALMFEKTGISSASTTINLDLPVGTYVVRLSNEFAASNQKLIIAN